MVSVNVAPTWGNTRNIPNEDSSDFEFDETNLFEPDRFPGLDRVDTGTRVAYGLRFSSLARARPSSAAVRPELLVHHELVHPAGVRRPGQSVGLCRRVLRAAERAARPQLPLPPRQGRPEIPPQDALAAFGPSFLGSTSATSTCRRSREAFDDEKQLHANPTGFESREEITLGVRLKLTDQHRHRRADPARPQRQRDHRQPGGADLYAPVPDPGGGFRAAAHPGRAARRRDGGTGSGRVQRTSPTSRPVARCSGRNGQGGSGDVVAPAGALGPPARRAWPLTCLAAELRPGAGPAQRHRGRGQRRRDHQRRT